MRVRAQDANGDYTFGRGLGNFLVNSPAAVAQLVQTRLLLMQGEWFLDKTAGMPWATQVIGTGTKPFYDVAIQNEILNTVGVTSIANYSSVLNAAKRSLVVTATVVTQFGAAQPITVPVNV